MGILELQNLTYSYDKKRKVLRGINAQMEAGKMYAILGPSGCGKTTLLSLLGGLDSPTSGNILFEGKDIAQAGLAGHRKKNVSFIFQSYNLIDYMTPQENVRLRCAGVMRGKPPPGVRSISGGFLLMRSSAFSYSAVLPESRSCPIPAACPGVGTLTCFGPS